MFNKTVFLLAGLMIFGGLIGGIIGHFIIGDKYKQYLDLETNEIKIMWVPQGSIIGFMFGMFASAFTVILMYLKEDK